MSLTRDIGIEYAQPRGFRQPMSEERVERRLSAILAADVAGCSRLMGIDEEGVLVTACSQTARYHETADNR